MAVAGDTAHIPSMGVTVRYGGLTPTGITVNRPRMLVFSDNERRRAGDLYTAAQILRAQPAPIIAIDPRDGGYLRLCALWAEEADD